MIVSTMSSGDGSVAVSARPAFPTTIKTSGKPRSTASRAFRSSVACFTDIRGSEVGMSRIDPSSRGGMNSLPSRVDAR